MQHSSKIERIALLGVKWSLIIIFLKVIHQFKCNKCVKGTTFHPFSLNFLSFHNLSMIKRNFLRQNQSIATNCISFSFKLITIAALYTLIGLQFEEFINEHVQSIAALYNYCYYRLLFRDNCKIILTSIPCQNLNTYRMS